jgi:hypothetical protein
MKNCNICKKDFESATRKQKFCSNSCRQKNYRKEVKDMIAEIRLKKDKIKPILDVSVQNVATSVKIDKEVQKTPPIGLKGIELLEWKMQNLK